MQAIVGNPKIPHKARFSGSKVKNQPKVPEICKSQRIAIKIREYAPIFLVTRNKISPIIVRIHRGR